MGSFYDRVLDAVKGERRLCDNGGFFGQGYSNCEPFRGQIVTLCTGPLMLIVRVHESDSEDDHDYVEVIGYKEVSYVDEDHGFLRFRRKVLGMLASASIQVGKPGGAS